TPLVVVSVKTAIRWEGPVMVPTRSSGGRVGGAGGGSMATGSTRGAATTGAGGRRGGGKSGRSPRPGSDATGTAPTGLPLIVRSGATLAGGAARGATSVGGASCAVALTTSSSRAAIAPQMIKIAVRPNQAVARCRFILNLFARPSFTGVSLRREERRCAY